MLETIMYKYFPHWDGIANQGASGWNNTTYFMKCGSERYVLRIYAHGDSDKIKFEHVVLEALQRYPLGFKVPVPMRTLTGDSIVKVEDGSGRNACLFTYIEGLRPEDGDSRAAYSFGVSAGELVNALTHLQLDILPVYRPYYELQQSYPACSQEAVTHFCENPPEIFSDLQEPLRVLGHAYLEVGGRLDGLELLPQQLIHGDLNFSNLLVDEAHPQTVVALLDFEFCTRDVRAMEPAVIISGLLEQKGDKEAIRQFWRGFNGKVQLTPAELSAIPLLMMLRKVDVFLHFMNRYLNRIDASDVLRQQIQSLAVDIQRLTNDCIWIEKLLRNEITEME